VPRALASLPFRRSGPISPTDTRAAHSPLTYPRMCVHNNTGHRPGRAVGWRATGASAAPHQTLDAAQNTEPISSRGEADATRLAPESADLVGADRR